MTDFMKGLITGAAVCLFLFGVIFALWFYHRRDRGLIEYAERQFELQELREDYINRDPAEFLEIPGVRGAADNAADNFERKRDEILHRFRNRIAD